MRNRWRCAGRALFRPPAQPDRSRTNIGGGNMPNAFDQCFNPLVSCYADSQLGVIEPQHRRPCGWQPHQAEELGFKLGAGHQSFRLNVGNKQQNRFGARRGFPLTLHGDPQIALRPAAGKIAPRHAPRNDFSANQIEIKPAPQMGPGSAGRLSFAHCNKRAFGQSPNVVAFIADRHVSPHRPATQTAKKAPLPV